LFSKISIKPIDDFLDGGWHWCSGSMRLYHIQLRVWAWSMVLQMAINLGIRCVTIPNTCLWHPKFLISVINANNRISWVKPTDIGQTMVNLGHHLENLVNNP
jgi:hypothetical protein